VVVRTHGRDSNGGFPKDRGLVPGDCLCDDHTSRCRGEATSFVTNGGDGKLYTSQIEITNEFEVVIAENGRKTIEDRTIYSLEMKIRLDAKSGIQFRISYKPRKYCIVGYLGIDMIDT